LGFFGGCFVGKVVFFVGVFLKTTAGQHEPPIGGKGGGPNPKDPSVSAPAERETLVAQRPKKKRENMRQTKRPLASSWVKPNGGKSFEC